MIKKKSLVQQVADDIYRLIVEEKEFKPGEQLPNENILSSQLGVSRATLREAIRILASQGVLDLYEARLLFEPEIAAIACRRATDGELENIFEIGHEVEKTILNGVDRTEIDQEFHRAIVQASHNDFMMRLLPVVNRAVKESIMLNDGCQLPSEDILAKDTLRDHGLLMEFLKKRDAAGAKYAMSIHLHHAITNLNLNVGEDPIF